MADYEITFKVDGKIINEAEILKMELSRYFHVFKIFEEKGQAITLQGEPLLTNELYNLDLETAKKALAETKENIGKAGTLQLFAPEIERGDSMWIKIAENSREQKNMQQAIVEVETTNISLGQFLMFNQMLARKNNLYLPSEIHPEHYYFDANKQGEQVIVETFGMYKDPSYLDLKPGNASMYPIQPDSDAEIIMAGQTFLKNNEMNTKMIGMHQLKRTKTGMKVKLGVFLPEAAPKEIAEGHLWHLMVEFNNGLHIAAQQRPNLLQKAVLNMAINKMKRSNQREINKYYQNGERL